MNIFIRQLLQSLVLGIVLPAMLLSPITECLDSGCAQVSAMETVLSESVEITVLNRDGEAQTLDLEEYVTRVLLGEVSSGFSEEALKAQAVAARTYTMYSIVVTEKHSVGAVCMDYRCCQAYCEPEEYINQGGSKRGLQKIREAVMDTMGEVLTYDSQLICATYFASSGGKTEDAQEVWGREYPYLRSVESPGEEDCGYFSDRIVYEPQQIQDALGVELIGSPKSWFGMVTYTTGCRVDLMRIGGRLYTGVELRKLLELRSTHITVTPTDDAIYIDTKGYGHRVGMSQHGANAMAKADCDYREILAHYYQNTVIQSLSYDSD